VSLHLSTSLRVPTSVKAPDETLSLNLVECKQRNGGKQTNGRNNFELEDDEKSKERPKKGT
jgi:hypothetical protein